MAVKRGKKGKKGKSKGPKVSLSKLSNKHLNKLAKQGKLKKKIGDKKFRHTLLERTQQKAYNPELAEAEREAEDQQEEDIPLEEADYEYFAKPGRDLGFLNDVGEDPDDQPKRRKRKKDKDGQDEDDELERKYESSTRKLPDESGKKALLPIKDKKKVIPRTEQIEEEEDTDVEDEQPQEDVTDIPAKPLPALSTAELFAQRQQKLAERKQKMAVLASGIIENPEENYRKIRELRMMLSETDEDVMVTMKKLVMVTLMEVFKDIIPGYRIRLATEAEKTQVAKKETKKLREFEESLLTNYKHYLEFMEYMVKGKPPKSKEHRKRKASEIEIPEAAAQGLREVALKCLCELLATHPHFNFRTNIITVVIPYTNSKKQQISDMVCTYVKQIFKEDRSGEVSLELARLIGRIIKARNYDIQPKVLNTFLALKIRGVQREEDKPDNKEARREKIRKMSKKERKRHKQMGALEKELEDAAILDNKQHRLKLNTEIVNMIFLAYFRILKHGQDSVLLEPVLEGLAKFAHLINVEFFDDLFSVLNDLVDSGELTYRESLHCVQTAFTILSGQGAALNVDPLRFYKHLYGVLLQLHAGRSCQDVPIVLESLELMLVKRRKQVSLQRVLAFTKRLTTMALQLHSHGSLGVMASIRGILNHFPKCDILYDTESQGSGIFMPELEDPEHCNANSTALWELHTLRHHYHPVVRQYAHHLAAQAPSQGAGQLAPELLRKSPVGLFREYDPSEMEFKPEMQKKPQGKKKTSVVIPESLSGKAEDHLHSESPDLSRLNFHRNYTEHTPVTSCEMIQNQPSTAPCTVNGHKKPISKNKAKKRKFMQYQLSRLKRSR